MGAAYDSYDYSAYWADRAYEHNSEVIALRRLLGKIPKIRKIIDVGGGFGRLTPVYAFRAKNVILTEPSAKLLSQARKNLTAFPNIEYVQGSLDSLTARLGRQSADLVIMVRVLHHLTDLERTFASVYELLKPGGYLIFEFANKLHFKSAFRHILRRDFHYLSDLTSVDVRSPWAVKKGTIVFLNHHPNFIRSLLAKTGFEVKEKLSVSNLRSPFIKRYLPLEAALAAEKALQSPLGYLNFGPSIFILAQKKS